MTLPIDPDSNQLFSSAVISADSTSLAFRTDNVKNDFNRLALWLKGRLGSATATLQSLKPGIKIGSDVEADWADMQDIIPVPDVFLIKYLPNWQRLKISGVGAAITVVSATQISGVEVQYQITAHGLKVGDVVVMSGFTPAAYNGTFVVKSVTDANNFRVDLLTDPGGNATVVGTSASTVVEGYRLEHHN